MHYRRLALSLLAVVAVAMTGIAGAAAQDASGGGAFADLGDLPGFEMTFTDEELDGVPAETAAGWNRVAFTNDVTPTGDPFEDAWAVEFVLLPEGMTAADLAAMFAGMFAGPPPGTEGGAEGATPGADSAASSEMASPEAEGGDPFAILAASYQPGGPGALQGQTTEALLYLQTGEYAVLVPGKGEPAELSVTGMAAPEPPTVTADVVISETGTSGTFDFSTEVGSFAGGPAVVEIVNGSDQPHFVVGLRVDDPITEEEVMALLMAEMTGTPPADEPEDDPSIVTGTQSTGTTMYLALDLEPGHHILLCFVGDPNQGGIPHSFQGMVEVVPIGV